MGPIEEPIFDEVIRVEFCPQETDLVVHRDVTGDVFAFHSPLTNGPIHCDLCEKDRVSVVVRPLTA